MTTTVNPLRADPTRTATIRRVYEANLRRTFADLSSGIDKFVGGPSWEGLTPAQCIAMFDGWIKRQIDGLFTSGNARHKWAKSIADAFKFGADRAFNDMNRKRPQHSTFQAAAVRGAFHVRPSVSLLTYNRRMGTTPQEVLDVLSERNFTSLSGMTSAMANTLMHTLHNKLADGAGAKEMAVSLQEKVGLSAVRAERIARTEVIRAFAEGQLTMLEKMGVGQVGAQVEWSTARDGRVCPDCAEMEGEVYDIEDARGKIPLHPQCRCAWVPYFGKGEAARFGEDTAEEGQAVIDEQQAEQEAGLPGEEMQQQDEGQQAKTELLDEEIDAKRDEIKDAFDAGDHDKLAKLANELQELTNERDALAGEEDD